VRKRIKGSFKGPIRTLSIWGFGGRLKQEKKKFVPALNRKEGSSAKRLEGSKREKTQLKHVLLPEKRSESPPPVNHAFKKLGGEGKVS